MGVAGLLERSWAYRLWQAPFAAQKFAPILAHNDLRAARRVLDVGCGPGTNTHHFAGADYLGVDLNPAYVESARRRTGRRFAVADITRFTVAEHERYDFVLANSLFHHVDDAGTSAALAQLAKAVSDGGHLHLLDLVLPPGPSVALALARADRGRYARPLEAWRTLFTASFDPVVFEPYLLTGAGVTLWQMVYFKGRPRR